MEPSHHQTRTLRGQARQVDMEVRDSRTAHGRALEEIAPEGQQGERAKPSQSCNLMDATKG